MIRLMKNTFYKEAETKRVLCDFIAGADKLSMGEKCAEFEREFAKYQGREYAVFYNSGSSANLALIQSLLNLDLLQKGDYVGFSALTWATNVMPLMQLGLNPIPVDISLENLNVTSETLTQRLLSQENAMKALFVTNLLGFSGDLTKIRNICYEKKILLLEDNCEALGSRLDGNRLGNFGFASTFSFFVGHHLSTIEGGMVCTDNQMLYEFLVMARAHGWGRNLSSEARKSFQKLYKIDDFHEPYAFYVPGFNLRPTEITGVIGLEQLKYIDEIHYKRYLNFLKYHRVAMNNPDFQKLDFSHMGIVSNFGYPIILKNKNKLDEYRQRLAEVEIRPIVGGDMTQQPFYKGDSSCPNAGLINSHGFYIPNNPDLTDGELEHILGRIK